MSFRYYCIVVASLFVTWGVLSCTENERARSFGGTTQIALPAGQKLVNATWKESNIWYLTRPMREGEQPERYTFHEDSTYGINQGTVYFQEKR